MTIPVDPRGELLAFPNPNKILTTAIVASGALLIAAAQPNAAAPNAGLALLLPAGLPAAENRVTGADVAKIRAVIHRQIDAFRRDDAQSAFALVSPAVQQAYGTPERFLDVMRMSYRAVYRPSSVSFLELIMMGGEVVQQVQVTDRSGSVWVAYYAMQRQKDGSWRTHGCHLVQPSRNISA